MCIGKNKKAAVKKVGKTLKKAQGPTKKKNVCRPKAKVGTDVKKEVDIRNFFKVILKDEDVPHAERKKGNEMVIGSPLNGTKKRTNENTVVTIDLTQSTIH